MKKLKVLVIAEAANPEWVSVPLIGWSLSNALNREVDVHLVTQIRNREAILRTNLIESKDVSFIDSEMVAKPLWKIANCLRGGKGVGWTTTTAIGTLSYYYFERLVWQKFGCDISDGNFDIVHRVTPLSPVVPSIIAKKCYQAKVPFIIGPLNGGVPWPKEFDKARLQEKEWLTYIRNAYKMLPGYDSTLKYASAILTGSNDTFEQVPKRYQDKCIYLPENAIEPSKFSMAENDVEEKDKALRVCFIGRLVPYKGPDMVLEAIAPHIKNGQIKLDIIGDGPLMPFLKQFVDKEKLGDGVTIYGWIEHSKVQNFMCHSQLLIFPSIREFGGGVVLEAMALGVVPIVVDYAGPGELVTKETGFKIPLGTRDEIIYSLREKLNEILNNQSILNQMKRAARNRTNDYFTWQKKAQQVLKVYQWVLGEKQSKPKFLALPDLPW